LRGASSARLHSAASSSAQDPAGEPGQAELSALRSPPERRRQVAPVELPAGRQLDVEAAGRRDEAVAVLVAGRVKDERAGGAEVPAPAGPFDEPAGGHEAEVGPAVLMGGELSSGRMCGRRDRESSGLAHAHRVVGEVAVAARHAAILRLQKESQEATPA
jgi:hypothetical protein